MSAAPTPPAPPLPHVGPRSRVRFRDLVIREEGARYVVGSESVGVFFAVDEDAVNVVRLLEQGKSVEDVELQLLLERGETFDVADAVTHLAERGLVAEVDGTPVPLPKDVEGKLRASPGRAGPILAAVHGWPGALLVVTGAAATAAVFLRYPDVVPVPGEILLSTPSPFLTLLLATFLSLVTVSFHEFGHWIAALSYGVHARIRLSARLYFLVMETDVTPAWKLPPGPRSVIFLGGMSANVVMLGLVSLAFAAREWAWWDPPFLTPVARILLFFNLFQIVFQLFVFLRSDLYFLFTAVTGEWNLHQDVQRWFAAQAGRGARGLIRAVTGRRDTAPVLETEGLLGHAPQHFTAYAIVLVTGTLTALAFLGYYLTGMWGTFVPLVLERLTTGFAEGRFLLVAEGVGVLAYLALLVGLIVNFWIIRTVRNVARWWREETALV